MDGEGSGDGRIGIDGAGETDSDRSDAGDTERLLQFFNQRSGVMRLPEIGSQLSNSVNMC